MRRWTAVVLLGLVTACGAGPGAGPQADTADAGWRAVPAGPLSARHSSLAVAVGDELLLLGGSGAALCPANASCAAPTPATLVDAAAYDVGGRQWRALAPLPVPLSAGEAQAVVLDDAVHVLASSGRQAGAHLRYDVARDAWERLPSPPDPSGRLVAAGDVLAVHSTTQEDGLVRPDLLYDPVARTWQGLPRDPLLPSFDRVMTWCGTRIVLTAPEVTPSPGGATGPAFLRSAVLDLGTRAWTRLPDQTEVITYGSDLSWDGEHVVSPYVSSFDGGEVEGYGRALPTGGLLDPGTGQWSPLPPAPEPGDGQYRALSRRWSTAGEGLVLDTERDRWLPLSDHDEAVDQGEAAAWVGDRLVVWGGGRAGGLDGGEGALSAAGAVWSPRA